MSHPELSVSSVNSGPVPDPARVRTVTRVGRTLATLTDLDDILCLGAVAVQTMFDAERVDIVVSSGPNISRLARMRRGDATPTLSPAHQNATRSLADSPADCVELMGDGEPIGRLTLYRSAVELDREHDKWLLASLADHIAAAALCARQAEAMRQRLAEEVSWTLDTPERRQMAISALSHDFRSPLLAIDIGCDILEEEPAQTAGDRAEIVEQIRIARQRLLILGENVVELARLTRGQVTIKCKPVQVRTAIDAAIEIVAPRAKADKHVIEVECDIRYKASADPNRLRLVLANLLSNAIKHTPSNGPIRVESRIERDTLYIDVRDRGPGIAREEREVIFLPYQRGSMDPSGGVGIGLTVARELARCMGGDVVLTPTSSPGSMFTLRLPLAG